jgi:hypothetical protein
LGNEPAGRVAFRDAKLADLLALVGGGVLVLGGCDLDSIFHISLCLFEKGIFARKIMWAKTVLGGAALSREKTGGRLAGGFHARQT